MIEIVDWKKDNAYLDFNFRERKDRPLEDQFLTICDRFVLALYLWPLRHQSIGKACPTKKTIKKTKTKLFREHPQRKIPETCDLWDSGHISDWEQQSQYS